MTEVNLQICSWKELKKPYKYIDQLDEMCAAVWPAYLNQGHFISLYDKLMRTYPQYQYAMIDAATERLVCNLMSVPLAFTEDDSQLPDEGWDWAITTGLEQARDKTLPKNALCVLEMTIDPDFQGKMLSKRMLKHVLEKTREQGFERIFGPARPNDKVAYPNIDIEKYVTWRVEKGRHQDAWLRFHEMMTGRIEKPCARSMTVTGSVADWEAWAQKKFPDSGDYIVGGALSLLHIDRETDTGLYVEPNVWMIYKV